MFLFLIMKTAHSSRHCTEERSAHVSILSFNSWQTVHCVDTDLYSLSFFFFFLFFSLFADGHRSVVQYMVDSPRTRIWIDTGLESCHLKSEFSEKTSAVKLASCNHGSGAGSLKPEIYGEASIASQ